MSKNVLSRQPLMGVDSPLHAGLGPFFAKEDTPYFAALGRFITQYALAEAGAHLFARHISGLGDERARVIFGGMRLSDLTDRIRQMMRLDTRMMAIYPIVDACLVHLDAIGRLRDKLVHRIVDYVSGELQVSNIFTAKSLTSMEKDIFKISDLEHMDLDCGAIFVKFYTLITPSDDMAKRLSRLRAPWRYTPPLPKTQKKQPRKVRKARKPQPPASAK